MRADEPRRRELRIAGDLAEVPRVAAALQEVCANAGLSAAATFRSEVAVVEAVNNAIIHGHADPHPRIVDIVIEVRGEDLVVEVAADGPPFTPPASPTIDPAGSGADARPPRDPALAESGRGWAIMRAWMDEATLERRGSRNFVRLRKRLTGEAPGETQG